MESPVQSSFIPHEAGAPTIGKRAAPNGAADLALMLSILIFAASAALAAGVFFYHQYLTSNADAKLADLQRAASDFQPTFIAEMQRLDNRMQAAQTILAAHIAPSTFFDLLGQVTAKTISYGSLTFDASKDGGITLDMNGVAQSVNSIAFQDGLLAKAQVAGMLAFQSPIFSHLDHQPDGVHFTLAAKLNTDVINFGTVPDITGVTSTPNTTSTTDTADTINTANATNASAPAPQQQTVPSAAPPPTEAAEDALRVPPPTL